MDLIQITNSRLDVAAISASVTDQSTGATSLFVGTTRDNFQGKKVLRLEYEAYEGMARKELEKLCQQVRTKWPEVHKIALHHRLGVVEVTEASVVIAVSSPHRKDSLEVGRIETFIGYYHYQQSYIQAVQFAIDKLKENVPIWKKEIYEEGETAWKENKECRWRDGNG